ncbi:MAG TPA: hypothetical protein VFI47_28335, partial [Acidimicrobiales bacterium]|nr:hypothetical protein [Acidimicrobiales bacterium]
MEPARILRYLADVAAAPASDRHPLLPPGGGPELLDVTRTGQAPQWLGTTITLPLGSALDRSGSGISRVRATSALREMAALDALQAAEHILRVGWITIAGTVTVEGRTVTCCFPLLSQPVRLGGGLVGGLTLLPAGSPELTPLVTDPEVAARLEAGAQYGGGALDPQGGGGEPTAALL